MFPLMRVKQQHLNVTTRQVKIKACSFCIRKLFIKQRVTQWYGGARRSNPV